MRSVVSYVNRAWIMTDVLHYGTSLTMHEIDISATKFSTMRKSLDDEIYKQHMTGFVRRFIYKDITASLGFIC